MTNLMQLCLFVLYVGMNSAEKEYKFSNSGKREYVKYGFPKDTIVLPCAICPTCERLTEAYWYKKKDHERKSVWERVAKYRHQLDVEYFGSFINDTNVTLSITAGTLILENLKAKYEGTYKCRVGCQNCAIYTSYTQLYVLSNENMVRKNYGDTFNMPCYIPSSDFTQVESLTLLKYDFDKWKTVIDIQSFDSVDSDEVMKYSENSERTNISWIREYAKYPNIRYSGEEYLLDSELIELLEVNLHNLIQQDEGTYMCATTHNNSEILTFRRLLVYNYKDRPIAEKIFNNGFNLWKLGRIPYIFNGTFDDKKIRAVRSAMDAIEKVTCIKWDEVEEDENFPRKHLAIESSTTYCEVHLSKEGVQTLKLGSLCSSRGFILHLLLHVLGLPHEHQRPDRDYYLEMISRIPPPDDSKIAVIENESWIFNNVADMTSYPFDIFDYESVMHYPKEYVQCVYLFQRENRTQTPYMGYAFERGYLTKRDAAKINLLYCTS